MQRAHTLILIRHAQSEHHIADLTGGWTDTDLTPLGRQQAQALAARLQRELEDRPLRLISSDLKRGVQTAEILAQALHLPFSLEPGLRDYNNGSADGMARSLADNLRAPIPPDFMSWRSHPGAESWGEYLERVWKTLDALPDFDGYTLIVTHAGTINCAPLWWLNIKPHYPGQPWIDCHAAPTCLTILSQNENGEPVIHTINDYAHLWGTPLSPPSIY